MTDNTVTGTQNLKTVDIGICTYRRPALVATLLSLFEAGCAGRRESSPDCGG